MEEEVAVVPAVLETVFIAPFRLWRLPVVTSAPEYVTHASEACGGFLCYVGMQVSIHHVLV